MKKVLFLPFFFISWRVEITSLVIFLIKALLNNLFFLLLWKIIIMGCRMKLKREKFFITTLWKSIVVIWTKKRCHHRNNFFLCRERNLFRLSLHKIAHIYREYRPYDDNVSLEYMCFKVGSCSAKEIWKKLFTTDDNAIKTHLVALVK